VSVSGVPAFVADRRLALSGVQPLERLRELVTHARALRQKG
jgi:predicted DsbA family dithiol-disulfide isomerase